MSEIAWAAGLFEGEGCFTVSTSNGKYRQARVKLRSTDEDVVRRFHQAIGLGTVREDSYFKRSNGYKTQWEWYARSAEVVQVIDMLLPWMCSRRRERALEVREVAVGGRRSSM